MNRQKQPIHAMALATFFVVIADGCGEPGSSEPVIETQEGVVVQHLRGSASDAGTYIGLDFLATDSNGQPIACDDANLEVDVAIAFDDAPNDFISVRDGSVRLACAANRAADIGLVLDNSGSQESVLEITRQGAKNFAADILADGGELSLTRVSTFSSVLTGMTDDAATINSELDGMFVNGGWTALYDGVRMGNETLGASQAGSESFDTVDDFCQGSRRKGLVVFTNGFENNSAQEKLAGERDDGIDTTLSDLGGLEVNSVGTPLYIIGLGDKVNDPQLQGLADETGGRYLQVQKAQDIPAAYSLIADYQGASSQVCMEFERRGCGHATVRVSYDYTSATGTYSASEDHKVYIPCEEPEPQGKIVTILMALSDQGVDDATATRLLENSINWVNPTNAAPKILLVRDDNHRGEQSGEQNFLLSRIQDAGYDVTLIQEPRAGLDGSEFDDYDVVWFTNPGFPWDDRSSYDAIAGFVAGGGGVVLSGDDLTWSMGRSFDTSGLTHLSHKNNGTRTCGKLTNNNKGERYRVQMEADSHPVIQDIESSIILYGNDIDHSVATNTGEEILAWGTLEGAPGCSTRIPVITAYDPN